MDEYIGIVHISDKEKLVANNKVFLLENNIVYVESNGEQTDAIAYTHYEMGKTLSCEMRGKIKYLIDLNNSGKNSPGARKIWKKMSELESTEKVALVGMHPVSRIIAAFVMEITSSNCIRFFITKEEALHWLNERV